MKIVNCKFKINKGFTLAEMLVSTAIIGILASTLLMSRSHYSDALVLKNQTYNLVSHIRQAQAYTLGAKSNSGDFGTSYGIYLNADTANNTSFIFFADDGDGRYEEGEAFSDGFKQIGDGVIIEKICGSHSNRNENCNPSLKKIAVTFTRPDPSAVVKILDNGGNQPGSVYAPGRIYLISPSGNRMIVIIDSTGQVSIE